MVGSGLILWAINEKRVLLPIATLMVTFLVYAALRITITSDHNFSAQAFLLSPIFGLLPLSVIGATVSLLAQDLQVSLTRSRGLGLKNALGLLVFVIPIPLIVICFGYINNPPVTRTLAYQLVSDNAVILFSLMLILMEVVWPAKKPTTLLILFMLILTLCTGAISLIGSTSIVAFWLATIVLLFWSYFLGASWMARFLAVSVVALAVFYLINSLVFQLFVYQSNFRPLLDGTLEVSSVNSRLVMLTTFFDQFEVDPIFGNFMADQRIGLEQGSYVHSVILSLLTHTGVIGFLMIFIMLVAVAYVRVGNCNSVEKRISSLALIIGILGSLFAFFTWPPFWFFLGCLCVRPIKRLEYA
ncbi:hypothetical protein N9W42_01450 [Pseudomonadales bacterium]|nr:hypothetical protein [Pseudomonadales bacterium]